MIESHIKMAQLKQKPSMLQKQKNELHQQLARTQIELKLVEQNFKIVNRYIASEQRAMNIRQGQIFEMDNQVKSIIADLNHLRQKQCSKNE